MDNIKKLLLTLALLSFFVVSPSVYANEEIKDIEIIIEDENSIIDKENILDINFSKEDSKEEINNQIPNDTEKDYEESKNDDAKLNFDLETESKVLNEKDIESSIIDDSDLSKLSSNTLKTTNKTGWIYVDNAWYYFLSDNGLKSTDWLKIDEDWYYLDPANGKLRTGWQLVDNRWYYLNKMTGIMDKGWIKVNNDWYLLHNEYGHMKTGWQIANNKWYYLDKISGIMQTGWIKLDNEWYYLDSKDGDMKTGWQKINNYWYYLDPVSGVMQKGWIKLNQSWYLLHSTNGDMKTGWQIANNKWYFLDMNSGEMQKDWLKINNKWYYLDSLNGDMKTGWIKLNDKWYYLTKPSGELITGYFTLGNEEHYSNESGEWLHTKKVSNSLGKIFYLVLDPGHGAGIAHNRGGVLFNEGDQNFLFTQEIINASKKYNNVIVTSTRNTNDEDPSFEDRAKAGNGAHLYVSIHSNAADSYVRGVEIWGSNQNESHEFGKEITKTWSEVLNTPNRGVKYSQKPGIRDTTVPVKEYEDTWFVFKDNTAKEKYLLESVFHTNRADSQAYLDNQKTLADKFMQVVAKHFDLKLR